MRKKSRNGHLHDEQSLLKSTLESNGYPRRFIDRYSRIDSPPEVIYGPEKKPIYLRVPFRGDSFSSLLKRRLNSATRQAFPASQPKVLFRTSDLGFRPLKDKIPFDRAAKLVYEFICNCGSSYLGRTKRVLSERIGEHLPLWLLNGANRRPRSAALPNSAITRHCLACDHFDRSQSAGSYFKIVTRARIGSFLPLLEATFIASERPDLCLQKEFVFTLSLPWQ